MSDDGSNKKASPGIFAYLGNRFALRKADMAIIGLAALLISVWVIWQGGRANEGLLGRPLRVGIVPWPGYIGGLVANNGYEPNKDSDFWRNRHGRKDGLLVEFVFYVNQDKLEDDFAHGRVDVMWSTVDSLAHQLPSFIQKGIQARAFMQVDWSRGGDAIIAINAINGVEKIEHLKDKKVAVTMAASQWLLEYSLANSGLSQAEIDNIKRSIVSTEDSSDALEELKKQNVEVAVVWEPDVTEITTPQQGKREVAHVVVDTAMAPNLIADVMVAKEEFIHKNPDVINAFIEGWLVDGTTKATNDPEEAARLFTWVMHKVDKKRFNLITEAKARVMLEKVELATLSDNGRMFGFSAPAAVFDQIFHHANNIWLQDKERGLNFKNTVIFQVDSRQARDTDLLEKIYARTEQPFVQTGCGQAVMSPQLTVEFFPGKAELTPQAKKVLDDEASFLAGAYSGIPFCVEAYADKSPDSPEARKLSWARANVANEYLAWRCLCPRRHFVSGDNVIYETAETGQRVRYIRLRLINAKDQKPISGSSPISKTSYGKQ